MAPEKIVFKNLLVFISVNFLIAANLNRCVATFKTPRTLPFTKCSKSFLHTLKTLLFLFVTNGDVIKYWFVYKIIYLFIVCRCKKSAPQTTDIFFFVEVIISCDIACIRGLFFVDGEKRMKSENLFRNEIISLPLSSSFLLLRAGQHRVVKRRPQQ